MAVNTEVNVRINVDAKGADSSVGSIKKQLSEASAELLDVRERFGATSVEAANAAKKVADLNNEINGAKSLVEAFNPGDKFAAFGAALQGVAGGFAAVQGAQALFGSESESVSRTLAKVQGAMALSQGINSVLQAKDAFKNLGLVLSNNVVIQRLLNFVMTGSLKTQQQLVAQKEVDAAVTVTQTAATTGLTVAQNAARIAAIALRGALAATGIGLLVIGVGMLVSKIGDWISGEKNSEKAIEASNKALEKQQENYKNLSEEIKYQGEIRKLNAEIAGASQKELFQVEQKNNKEQQKGAQDNYNKLSNQYTNYINNIGELRDDGNRYYTEKELEQKHKIEEQRTQAYNELLNLQRDYTKNSLNEQKRLHELSIQAEEELTSLQQENYLAGIKDEDTRNKEKARLDLENAKKALAKKGYASEKETPILVELEKKKNLQISAIEDAAYQKQKSKRDANAKERKAEIDKANKEIADATKALNDKIQALNDEVYLMSIENEDKRSKEKLRIQFEAGIKEIEQSKANENLKLDAILALQAKYDADLKAIDDARTKKNQEEADAKRQAAIDYENETFNLLEENRISRIQDANQRAFEEESKRYQADIDNALAALNAKEISETDYKARREALELIHQGKLTDIEKAAGEERKKQSEAEYQAKVTQFQEIGGLANELSNIIGQNTAVGKALALSQIAIDTGVAISALTRNSEANPANAATSGIAGAIQFASGLIRIIANIKKAKDILSQAKVKGAGGGGTTPNISVPTAAPLPPQMSTTMLNQGQINQLSSATNRAFVLESDVTGNQERIQRLNRAARIS